MDVPGPISDMALARRTLVPGTAAAARSTELRPGIAAAGGCGVRPPAAAPACCMEPGECEKLPWERVGPLGQMMSPDAVI